MSIATIQSDRLGANPFVVEGPIVSGSGIPGPNFALGAVAGGAGSLFAKDVRMAAHQLAVEVIENAGRRYRRWSRLAYPGQKEPS